MYEIIQRWGEKALCYSLNNVLVRFLFFSLCWQTILYIITDSYLCWLTTFCTFLLRTKHHLVPSKTLYTAPTKC